MAKTTSINNFEGGLNKGDPTTIEDNQFEELQNMFYNSSKRLQTRRGVATFGQPVPDTTVLLEGCESDANFTVSDDATNLTTSTAADAIRGGHSIQFDIDVATSANNYAIINNSSLGTLDISATKSYFTQWLYVPSAFNTNLTSVKVQLGSDSSNYYEWTLGTLTEDSNNFLVLLFSNATVVGSPNDASINWWQMRIDYSAAYTNKSNLLVDALFAYSSTSTSPPTSYLFHEFDDLSTGAFVVAGTNIFKYDESTEYWECVDIDVTEYETLGTRAGNRTRWDFLIYKDSVYGCNGVDAFRSITSATTIVKYYYCQISANPTNGDIVEINGVTCTFVNALVNPGDIKIEGTADDTRLNLIDLINNPSVTDATHIALSAADQLLWASMTSEDVLVNQWLLMKYSGSGVVDVDSTFADANNYWVDTLTPRYLELFKDRIYSFGDDDNPSTLYYTDAAPLGAYPYLMLDNSVVIGGDETGKATGLTALGDILLTAKSSKIYATDVSVPEVSAIDYTQGLYSDRATASVENALFYYNGRDINQLTQRDGVSGSAAILGDTLSNNVANMLDDITANQYEACVGTYFSVLKNYYFAYDSNDDNIPDKVILYSSRVPGAWSEYTWPSYYDAGFYRDVNGVVSMLLMSAASGQMIKVESGFTDFDIAIPHLLRTKAWDYDSPETLKTFTSVDIYGLMSEGGEIDVDIIVDGESVMTTTINDTFLDLTSQAVPIGVEPIGVELLGGGGSGEDVDTYKYNIRIPFYATGQNIQVQMESNVLGMVWTLDKIAIVSDDQTFDIYPTSYIA